jgi:hypothetical protein
VGPLNSEDRLDRSAAPLNTVLEFGAAACGARVRASRQQPDGGDTPGVAAAPVALAGAIVPGVARFIVMLSAQADVFGVGTTVIGRLMLVPTN